MTEQNLKVILTNEKNRLYVKNNGQSETNLEIYKKLRLANAASISFTLLRINTDNDISDISVIINSKKIYLYKYSSKAVYINGHYLLDTADIEGFTVFFSGDPLYKYDLSIETYGHTTSFEMCLYGVMQTSLDYPIQDGFLELS